LRALTTCLLPVVFFLAGSPPAVAVEMKTFETPNLRLVYFDPVSTYLVPHAARCFENSLLSQRARFQWDPQEKVTVLLKDFSDYGNASARASPHNTLVFDIAPLSFVFETFTAGERMCMLMNHELVHVATMDQATARDRRFRRLFGGKVVPDEDHPESIMYWYLTAPRNAVPRWFLEGAAVFMETWMAGGIGRAQGAFDEMVFRAKVLDGARFYDPLGLVSEGTKIDFQVGVNAYLYGTRFMSYLALTYSPRAVIDWVARTEGSEAYYADQFRKVFGLPLDTAWARWIAWERDFQQANLRAIRAHPPTPYRDLSKRAMGSISRAWVDPAAGELYAGVRYPGVVAHVAALSLKDGSVRKLHDIKNPMLYRVTSLAYDPQSRTLFYTADNNAFRDLVALDARTGEARTLLTDARIGDLAFNPADRSLWGIRHLNGIATIVRIPAPYTEWTQVHSFPYGDVLYDLDISPDGRYLSTSFGNVSGQQSLRVMPVARLLAGDPAPVATFDFGTAVPEGFVFSADGRYLYGSSYYTGVSNIYRFELATGDLQALSNTETGLFRPVPMADGTLVALRYTGQGFVPTVIPAQPIEDLAAITFLGQMVVERNPEIQAWQVGLPSKIPLESMTTGQGDYRFIRGMRLESAYPVLEGYKDSIAAGVHAKFSDPLGYDLLSVTATYSPDDALDTDERLHLRARMRHREWTAELAWNGADFYDILGPTKKSQKGYAASLKYDKSLIFDRPRQLDLDAEIAFYGDLDRLPGYQNVEASIDKVAIARFELDYRNARSSLGHVDDEKGYRWRFAGDVSHADGDLTPRIWGSADLGMALPAGHSSLWLLTSAGTGIGDREDPFANFFFGGFGNNYLDNGEIKRYREVQSFPGFEIDEIGGRSFVKAMLEWNLPPLRFRAAGTPALYASWVRPALFAGVLAADPDAPRRRRTYSNLGGQLDVRLGVLSDLEMTLSLGYAAGFVDGERSGDEFMLSLKVR